MTRPLLEQFSSQEQVGLLFDAVIMAAGLLMPLQLRQCLGGRILIQKADLACGFDIA